MTAQYECYQKIMQDPIHRKEGRVYFLIRFSRGRWSIDITEVIQDPFIILIIAYIDNNFFRFCSYHILETSFWNSE